MRHSFTLFAAMLLAVVAASAILFGNWNECLLSMREQLQRRRRIEMCDSEDDHREQGVPAPIDEETCALYTKGHQIHHIQARLGWEAEARAAKPLKGTVVSVSDNGWITVDVGSELRRFWNHDAAWARAVIERSGGMVGLPGFHLLHAPTASGTYCICVADGEHGATSCKPLSERAHMVAKRALSGRVERRDLDAPPKRDDKS